MTIPFLLFIALAVVLVLVLAWAARPPQKAPVTPDQAFEALSQDRHYARLPQILQALREEDTEFMRDRGQAELLARVRKERKRIALRYLRYLQEEFRILQECSSILATLAPELAPKGELERFWQNLQFVGNCQYLHWRLRLGMQPWDVFGRLSDMAGTVTLRLEAASSRLAERAASTGDHGRLVSDERRGHSK